ncbi:MAG: spore cortex biosynthesis protein YabQ [Clostridia bacterium]|nr:spore cortex biosynthesis protein YabQ [Clostridia bacterium]
MENNLFSQFALALWSLAVGAFLCAVYDIFRLLRLRRKQNALVLFLCDLLFCAIAAVCAMLLFFNLSYGKMRAYSFVLIAFGFMAWRLTVSRFVMSLLNRLLTVVSKILNSIKMRVLGIIKLCSRRIYTAVYCKRAIASARKLKPERKENENDTEKTVAR